MWQELLDGLQKTNSNFVKNQEASLSNSTQPCSLSTWALPEYKSHLVIQVLSPRDLPWTDAVSLPSPVLQQPESQAASAGRKALRHSCSKGQALGGASTLWPSASRLQFLSSPRLLNRLWGTCIYTHIRIDVHTYGRTFEPGWFLCKRGAGKAISAPSIYLMAYLGQVHFISREEKKTQLLPTDRRTWNISSGCQDAII